MSMSVDEANGNTRSARVARLRRRRRRPLRDAHAHARRPGGDLFGLCRLARHRCPADLLRRTSCRSIARRCCSRRAITPSATRCRSASRSTWRCSSRATSTGSIPPSRPWRRRCRGRRAVGEPARRDLVAAARGPLGLLDRQHRRRAVLGRGRHRPHRRCGARHAAVPGAGRGDGDRGRRDPRAAADDRTRRRGRAFKRFEAMRRPRVDAGAQRSRTSTASPTTCDWPFTPRPRHRAAAAGTARAPEAPRLALRLRRRAGTGCTAAGPIVAPAGPAGLAACASAPALCQLPPSHRQEAPCLRPKRIPGSPSPASSITILLDMVGYGIIVPVLPELIKDLTGGGVAEAAVFGGWLVFVYAVDAVPVLAGARQSHRPLRAPADAARLAARADLRLRR